MLIRPAIGDTDPIRYRRPNPDGQFSGNILDEAMRGQFSTSPDNCCRRCQARRVLLRESGGVIRSRASQVPLHAIVISALPALIAQERCVRLSGEQKILFKIRLLVVSSRSWPSVLLEVSRAFTSRLTPAVRGEICDLRAGGGGVRARLEDSSRCPRM